MAVMFPHSSRAFQTVPLFSSGTTLKIRTLVDAAEALLLQWPADDGEEYVVVVKKCLNAVMGVAPANHTRQALIAAASEAGMRAIARHL
jgi:hypothetical protein